MKYGMILHNYGEASGKEAGFNIGDPIQSLALKEIYQYMEIPESEIQIIDLCELKTYNGEYVLLPMIGVALGINFAPLPLSPQIIPVFISSHFAVSELSSEAVDYLKNYAPIGCRDEYSLKNLREYSIPAFLSGCITTTFNRRKNSEIPQKIYFIDTPESLDDYIPMEIKNDIIKETHLLPLQNNHMNKDVANEFLKISADRLTEYSKHARLIVSSRMHAIVPCMAMGIPVIAAFENISYRFSWLDKLLKLHTKETFDEIDWNVSDLYLEEEKMITKNVVVKSIKTAFEKYNDIYSLSEYYENRVHAKYGNRYHDKLEESNLIKYDFEYIIWGCGLIGNTVFSIMKEKFPEAKLIVAVDEHAEGFWHDVEIIKSNKLHEYANCFIIIATYSGKEMGYNTMEKLGRKEKEDFIFLGTING